MRPTAGEKEVRVRDIELSLSIILATGLLAGSVVGVGAQEAAGETMTGPRQ